ncbi:hypothetical protein N752_10400 [Desulforamulus aquiferis]|nr:hypothetical protein N752_10400 [Desulforamulus aquiferis]
MIVVDPGHGGRDPGKVGHSGVPEKDINLEVSKRLATLLGQMGAAVILTRETDIDLSDSSASGWHGKKRQDLSRRVAWQTIEMLICLLVFTATLFQAKESMAPGVFSARIRRK